MKRALRGVARGFVALCFITYPMAVYVGLTRWNARWVAVALLVFLLPIIVSRLRGASGRALRSVAALPLLAAALLVMAALLNASGLVLLVPVVINAGLLASFGATLRGEIPMIERFARLQDPDLEPDEVRWCRSWTWIWSGFFALNAVLALVLALWAPLSWWTVYNGLVAYVLLGCLLAGEYVARKLRFARFGSSWPDRLLARLHKGDS